MRVVNGTTARRGATSGQRCSRARAFFGWDQASKTRSSGGQDANNNTDKPATGNGWLSAAPQIRVRQANDRAKSQLGELVLLNESLMGQEPWKIRQKLEYLKSKRQAWEGVCNAACKQEISLTVAHLESAMAEVDEALKEGGDEYRSITDARAELVELLEQVEEAHERLHLTQARVELNVEKLTELKAEAAEFSRLKELSVAQLPVTHPESADMLGAQSITERDGVAVTSRRKGAVARAPGQAGNGQKKMAKGLQSSLDLEAGLRNFWYAVGFTSKVKSDTLIPVELFGQPWVVFRDETGHAACVRDECAHRACPLSAGTVVDGHVQCPYHGWTFNSQGECTKMPSTVQCKGVKVSHLPCVERDGLVWIWPGDAEPVEVPTNTLPPGSFTLHSEIEVEVPVEHGLLMENLLDLAHAPFTHTSTFAKGWPVPDAVRFHAQKLLGGNWDPYPIDMSFEPPCMVLSMIGLKQPGQIEAGAQASECDNHLHQLHVCLPSRKGHTRLLYRMHLDFMPWVKHVPFINKFWEYIAGEVLGEDLVLVQGQQDRMQRGGDTWKSPVSYDKLAVRYRRWRNDLDEHEKLPSSSYKSQSMDAANLFSLDEDEVLASVGSPAHSAPRPQR